MSAIVIVIENVAGSTTERDIREQAEALAFRLGGRLSSAQPITEFNPPSVLALLCGAVARIKTSAALRRITQE